MSNNNTPIEEDLDYLDYCYDTVVDRNKDLERQLEEANTEIRDLNDMLVALREETDAELKEAREEFSRLVDNMGYFTQRQLANRISKVHKHLKEKGDE